MKSKLTNDQLNDLEKKATLFIAKYGDVPPNDDGPPTPGEVLALVMEIKEHRARFLQE